MTAVATCVADGSAPAVEELVSSHLPLVGYLVRELMGKLPSHVNRDDLVSAGMMALVLAARGFDDGRKVPFARFAAIRIKGALIDELRSMDWASRGVRSKAREVEAVRNTIAAQLGRSPQRAEVAQTMGVSITELDGIAADVQRAGVLSLQGLTADDAEVLVPAAGWGPEPMLLKREELGYLHDAIAELPSRLRTVVEQYFFHERKMADIAADLGVTESRVSQLRSEALAYLRDGMRYGDDGAAAAATAVAGSASPASARRRASARESYCAAVTARSGLAQRLSATSALGDVRREQVPVSAAGSS